MGMRLWIHRLLEALIVVWGVSTIVFCLLRLSGDPTLLMVPPGAPLDAIERLRHQLGYDQPIPVQYAQFLWGLVRGDLGRSIVQDRPALDIVMERLPATLQLGGTALALALIVGCPIGIISAIYPHSFFDRVGMVLAILGQALPPFWLGLVLILFFAVTLRLFPPSGAETPQHLVLPSITLGVLSSRRLHGSRAPRIWKRRPRITCAPPKRKESAVVESSSSTFCETWQSL